MRRSVGGWLEEAVGGRWHDGDGDDDGGGQLVVPCHLLRVPEHPEVAEAARNGGQPAGDVADDAGPPAEGAGVGETHDPDVERLLADGLPGRAAFAERGVDDA